MAGQVIGYARCLAGDDERVQHAALAALGAPEEHIHIDVGYTPAGLLVLLLHARSQRAVSVTYWWHRHWIV